MDTSQMITRDKFQVRPSAFCANKILNHDYFFSPTLQKVTDIAETFLCLMSHSWFISQFYSSLKEEKSNQNTSFSPQAC